MTPQGRSFKPVLLMLFLLPAAALDAQTSITCTPGGGLQCTPNPIIGTGTIAISAPLSFANGGTGNTSFTAGSIPFSNGSALAQDSARLFWDSAAHRLRAPLQDLGGQVFNVMAYGAKGDGTTDDTASIQAAINAAGAGTVYLPPGNFKVSSALSLPNSGSTLVGAGVGATVITSSSTTANVIELGSSSGHIVPGVTVGNLSIAGSIYRTGGDAIRLFPGEWFMIDNVRIGPMGGNGIDATSGGVDQNIIFVSRVEVEIVGPFSAVLINGAGEFHLTHAWLQGPVANGGTVAGSVGIDLRDGNIFAADVETVHFEKGVFVHPDVGHFTAWSSFNNVLADTNSLYGWHFGGSGTIWGIQCANCWAGTNGALAPYATVNANGFRIDNGDGIVLIAPRVINNGCHGIEINPPAKNVEIAGGWVTGNSVAQSNYCSGMAINANNFRIHDVRSGPAAGQPSNQAWGIAIVGGDQYVVTGNDTSGNYYGGIVNGQGTSATKIVANNL